MEWKVWYGWNGKISMNGKVYGWNGKVGWNGKEFGMERGMGNGKVGIV